MAGRLGDWLVGKAQGLRPHAWESPLFAFGLLHPPIHSSTRPYVHPAASAGRHTPGPAPPPSDGAGRCGTGRGPALWLGRVRAAAIAASLVGLVVFLSWRASGFTSPSSLAKLGTDVALVALVSVWMTVVMAGGGIDLSVGAILALAAACSVRVAESGAPAIAAVAVALGIGLGLGALNGAVSRLTRLHPLAVTLAAWWGYRWLFAATFGGQPVAEVPQGLRELAQVQWLGVPAPVVLALAAAAGAFAMLRRHGGGRTRALSVLAFAACGATAGLAGLLWAGEYNALEPGLSLGFSLQVIAATLIGGASLRGGTGSVLGALAGALVVGVLHNGMAMLDVPSAHQHLVFGVVIVGVVLCDALARSLVRRVRA